ncbi:MAG: glycosyltransferase family 2 protein [Fusobacterium sp.]
MNSILIITYGRERELLDTLKCFQNYKDKLLELLILDNNETPVLKDKIFKTLKNEKIKLRYFNDGKNYGVALGRNYLIEKAKGDILITLDDDIEIKENINNFILKIENYFLNNKDIGCLAFNIVNFYSKKHLRHEIPHGNKRLDFNRNLKTYYFIGAGHAIKKEVYDKVGLYPNDLGKYGGEERDLSFRILEKGYGILYTADTKIYHKVSPNGRLREESFNRYRNQLIVLNRYMPKVYRISSNIIWTLFYLLKGKVKIKDIKKVFNELKTLKKETISLETLEKIKKMKGRILY